MIKKGAQAAQLVLSALALSLLVPLAAGAQAAPGEGGLEEAESSAGTNAYIRLLKTEPAYQTMEPDQQEAYIAAATEFITPDNAYERERNGLLVEAAEITLQMRAAVDEQDLSDLQGQYAAVMDRLEEYGVGPSHKTEEDPGYYFDKHEQALERLEGEDRADAAAAGPGDPGRGFVDSVQAGLAGACAALRGMALAVLDAVLQR